MRFSTESLDIERVSSIVRVGRGRAVSSFSMDADESRNTGIVTTISPSE